MLYNKGMVQDQLLEYISSQTKLGVARDTIRAALTGAGWAAADVEDTLKKVEGAAKPAGAPTTMAGSATAFTMGAGSATGVGADTARAGSVSPKSFTPSSMGGPSMVSMGSSPKMSDLVSSSSPAKVSPKMSPASMGSTSAAAASFVASTPKAKGGISMMRIVGIVLIVVLAALAGFFYYENTSLSRQVSTVGKESSDVSTQLATLTSQVTALDASNTALAAEVTSLTAQNTDLMTNLSFAAVPPLSSGVPATSTVSLTGTLTGGRSSFALTTQYGVVAYVANTKDAAVVAALTPLLTSSSTVTLTGTHTPGSQYLTVTAVNGSAVQ